jgi:hypothetical protein
MHYYCCTSKHKRATLAKGDGLSDMRLRGKETRDVKQPYDRCGGLKTGKRRDGSR